LTKNKGTKRTVENFFKFLGYEDYTDDRLVIHDILKPHAGYMTKTGYYEAFYNYYQNIPDEPTYDTNNLPNFEIDIHDLSDFITRVLNAIALANIYFTAEEQLITIFNIVFAANNPNYIKTISRNYYHSFHDTGYFRNDIKIDAVMYEELREHPVYLINNCIQYVQDLFVNEKVYMINGIPDNLYFFRIVNESLIGDDNYLENIHIGDSDFDTKLKQLHRDFGSIIHIKIGRNTSSSYPLSYDYTFYNVSPNFTDTYYINGSVNPYTETELSFMLLKYGEYKFIVNVYDGYGSKDTWTYTFKLSQKNVNIDFNIYNSSLLLPERNDIYTGTTTADNSIDPVHIIFYDPTTPYLLPPPYILGAYDNYVRDPSGYVNMPEYFDPATSPIISRYLHGDSTDKTSLQAFNKYNVLTQVTDTIPIDLLDATLHVCSFESTNNQRFYGYGHEIPYCKMYDPITGDYFAKVTDPDFRDTSNDNIYFLFVPIFIQKTVGHGKDDYSLFSQDKYMYTYIFVSTINGLRIPLERFYVNIADPNDPPIYESVLNMPSFREKNVPVFYDIPLHSKHESYSSSPFSTDQYYVSPTDHTIDVEQHSTSTITTLPLSKNVFPYLVDISKSLTPEIYYFLRLNDIVFAQLSPKYIDLPYNVDWEVSDSFTGETLYKTTDATLKYRCQRKTIIDVTCNFYLNNVNGVQEFHHTYRSINKIG
jgi:hypothetical protein